VGAFSSNERELRGCAGTCDWRCGGLVVPRPGCGGAADVRAGIGPTDERGGIGCGIGGLERGAGAGGGAVGVLSLGVNWVGVLMEPNCARGGGAAVDERAGSGMLGGSWSSGTMRRSVVRSSDGSSASGARDWMVCSGPESRSS
jgi:hypothetical protein